jgi:release factor glutamine methyltransferase
MMDGVVDAAPAVTLVAGMTVAHARRALAEGFRRAELDTPELDARVLAGHGLALDHTGLAVDSGRRLTDAEARALSVLAARRLAGDPVARIIGRKEFWGLPLRVTDATLVPRPETETVVEAALDALERDGPRTRPLRIADLGTGSGALLLALLSELPRAHGVGTDASFEALAVARENAMHHGLASRAWFAACDFGAALAGGFDLLVSNPPYVASGDIVTLPAEVRRDPRRALDGGADGLACYRSIACQAPRLLRRGGHLVVELGAGQDGAVTAVLAEQALLPSRPRIDLAGIPRALHARRPFGP